MIPVQAKKNVFLGKFLVLAVVGLMALAFQNCSDNNTTNSDKSQGEQQGSSSPTTQIKSTKVDMFLVIGQSNMRGRGPQTQPSAVSPGLNTAFEFDGSELDLLGASFGLGVGKTGIPTVDCGTNCYWTSNYYGILMSFAKSWKEKTGHNTVFVVRPKGGSSLTATADTGAGNWLDFSNSTSCTDGTLMDSKDPTKHQCTAIYRNAINDFSKAFPYVKNKFGINKSFVLWIQGENDIQSGVSAASYTSGLNSLLGQLDADLQKNAGSTFSGFLLAETGYFFNSAAYSPIDSVVVHRNKAQSIADAQSQIGRTGKFVLTSKSARVFMSPCVNTVVGQTTPYPADCGSFDLIHYNTSMYEQLGIEMATNGAIFSATQIKPFDEASCSQAPSLCAPTVDVFRFSNAVSGGHDHASSLLYNEFDSAQYDFKGVRFHLYKELWPGSPETDLLVPLYRKYNSQTKDYMDSTSLTGDAGYTNPTLLGYCYSSPQSQAHSALRRLKLLDTNGIVINRVSSQNATEIALFFGSGYLDDGLLCYVN